MGDGRRDGGWLEDRQHQGTVLKHPARRPKQCPGEGVDPGTPLQLGGWVRDLMRSVLGSHCLQQPGFPAMMWKKILERKLCESRSVCLLHRFMPLGWATQAHNKGLLNE